MITLDELRMSTSATVTVRDAAALLGVNPRTLSGALSLHGGDIRAVRIGRRVVIPRVPFLEWLDGKSSTEDQPAEVPAVDVTAAIRAKLIELIGQLEGIA